MYVHIQAVENNSTRKCEVVPVRGIEAYRRLGIEFVSFLTSALMDVRCLFQEPAALFPSKQPLASQ